MLTLALTLTLMVFSITLILTALILNLKSLCAFFWWCRAVAVQEWSAGWQERLRLHDANDAARDLHDAHAHSRLRGQSDLVQNPRFGLNGNGNPTHVNVPSECECE